LEPQTYKEKLDQNNGRTRNSETTTAETNGSTRNSDRPPNHRTTVETWKKWCSQKTSITGITKAAKDQQQRKSKERRKQNPQTSALDHCNHTCTHGAYILRNSPYLVHMTFIKWFIWGFSRGNVRRSFQRKADAFNYFFDNFLKESSFPWGKSESILLREINPRSLEWW
jgi:hypothetical protein